MKIMIKKILIEGEKTFDELFKLLIYLHTKQSLEIELKFLIDIGSIELLNNKYKLCKNIRSRMK